MTDPTPLTEARDDVVTALRYLHQPQRIWESDRSYTQICRSCQLSSWPCETAQLLDSLAVSEAPAPTEPDWEYGVVAEAFGGEPAVHNTLESAQHVRDYSTTLYKKWTHGSKVSLFRRRKAGPWEPVESEASDV